MADMTVANTILAQLGGNRFLGMTGAKNLTGSERGLTFALPRGARRVSGGLPVPITHVSIELKKDDTYKMTFLNCRLTLKRIRREEVEVFASTQITCSASSPRPPDWTPICKETRMNDIPHPPAVIEDRQLENIKSAAELYIQTSKDERPRSAITVGESFTRTCAAPIGYYAKVKPDVVLALIDELQAYRRLQPTNEDSAH